MVGRNLRVVHELTAIGKAVRGHVEDAHDLRLVQPHRSHAALQRCMAALEVFELHLQIMREVGQDRAQFSRRIEFARGDLAAFARDHGEAAGIGQAASQPNYPALLALRRFSQGDGAKVMPRAQSSVASR